MQNWITAEESIQRYGTPAYTGWGRAEADADFRAKGNTPMEGGAQAGGQVAGANAFNFDWNRAEQDAIAKLTPYYEQKLAENNYDVEKTVTALEQDYQRGLRYSNEDLAVANQTYSQLEPREQENLLTALNKRGVLQSTIRTDEQQYLTDTQKQRREATQRAIDRKNELAGITRARGTEEAQTAGSRQARDITEQKQERALDLANTQYNRDANRFLAETKRFTA